MLVWAASALYRADGAVLLRKRGDGELFAGLWDLPSSPVVGGGVGEALRGAAALCGIRRPPVLTPKGELRQMLTHREVRVLLFRGRSRARVPAGGSLRWALPAELDAIGLSSLARKCLRAASAS